MSGNWRLLGLAALVCVAGVSGCSGDGDDDDASVPVTDEAPSVSIDAPVSGTTVAPGASVTMSGTVSDDINAPGDIKIAWSSSIDGPLNSSPPDGQGKTSFTTTTLSTGEHTITLTATDLSEHASSKSVTLTVEAKTNEAPSATISAPADNASYAYGAQISLAGTVADAEDAASSLSAQFHSDLAGDIGGKLKPAADGKVTAAVTAGVTLEPGVHTITLVATDSAAQTGTSSPIHLTIKDNAAPVVTFTGPDETLFEVGEAVTLTAVISDDASVGSALKLSWSSSLDGNLASCPTSPDASGDVTCTISTLDAGDQVITLTATDAGGLISSDEAAFKVNGPPGAPQVSISPAEPTTADTLATVIVKESIDPNDDKVTYTYAWFRNNTATGISTATVPPSSTSKGESWKVTVTPTDGLLQGTPASFSVKIGNTAPTLVSAAVAPANGYISSTFYCVPSGFYDADAGTPEGYLYAWLGNGVEISGETGASIVPSSLKPGDKLSCRVTPTDGTTPGTAVTSAAVTLDDRMPSAQSASISPTTGGETTTFSCQGAGWSDPDNDPPGYRYQWKVNGVNGPATESITGADFNKGDSLVCVATPYDGILTGAAVTSSAVTVVNSAPTVTGLDISPDPGYADSSLRCQSAGYEDADNDGEVNTFQWSVNGKAVSGATSSTFAGQFKRGDLVGCAATVSDGVVTPQSLSASITISDAPPSISSVLVNPASGGVSTTFTAMPQGFADADGDSAVYQYQWYVNGVASVTTVSIASPKFVLNDEIYVIVTPGDSITTGTPKQSATITVGSTNNPPSIASVTLTPTTAYESSSLTCTPIGATDPEGDAITFTYAWYVGGKVVTGAATNKLTGASFSKKDMIECQITPKDSTNKVGAAVTSNKVTILNSAPTATSASISPSQPTKASTLTCALNGAADADGDKVDATYVWTVNGKVVTGVTGSSLSNASFSAGDQVLCTATPTDGEDNGTALTSSPVTIASSAPVVTSVSLAPTTAYESSTLTCTASGVSDADGDTVTLLYVWLKGANAISGQTTSTLTGASFSKGDAISCQVTPKDSTGSSGTAVKSNVVTILNSAPVVGSVSLSPTTAYETSTLTCAASAVSDADGETPTLAYAWTVNGKAIAATTATLTGSSFSRGDQVKCTVTPSDAAGAGTATDSNTVIISNSAPVLASVLLTPEPAYEDTVLTCTPKGGTDADSDQINYLYAWLVNSVVVVGANTPNLSGSSFKRGDTVACKVTPADDSLAGTAVQSNTVSISNQLPVLSGVTLSPSLAYETSTLTCTPGTATDADGDKVTFIYAWKVNGGVVSGKTTSTLTGSSFEHGDAVACVVTPTDGIGNGAAVTSSSVNIANSAPGITGAAVTPTTAYEASSLKCTPSGAFDPDPSDTVSFSYRWNVNSLTVAETSDTLTGAYFNKGNKVSCTVTPSDGAASGQAVTSSEITILNTPPTVSGVSLAPSSPTVSSTLTCSYSGTADDDTDSVTVAYSWKVNNVLVSATTATLTTGFKRGDSVVCLVTPSDPQTAGTAVSSSSVTILNAAPAISGVTLSPTTAYETTSLTCAASGSSDPDNDTVSLQYAWKVNNVGISASTSSLTGSSFNRGDTVSCTVTPTDGSTSGSALTSNTVTILNSIPTTTTPTLTPSTAYKNSTLTCSATASDADPGDTASLNYAWAVNSITVSGAITSQLSGAFVKGNSVTCTVTPTDGSASGTPKTSSAVVISNTAPTVTGVTLSPSNPGAKDTLTCGYGSTADLDNDSVTVAYSWTINSGTVNGAISSTLSSGFKRGDSVACTVTPNDGSVNGAGVTSSAVVIGNGAPVITSVSLAPTTAYETTPLTCTANGVSDPDNDTVSLSYVWKVNSVVVGSATTSSLTGASFGRGDVVACTVTPNDGLVSGSAVSSNSVTILNSVPSVTTPTLSPIPAHKNSTLTCSATGSDGDPGDTVTLGYAWAVNSVTVEGVTTNQLSGVFVKNDSVTCTVTPTDGTASGTPRTSAALVVSNSAPILTSVTLAPATAYEASIMTCTPGSSSDLDNDVVTFGYAWYVNGVQVSAATTDTLTGTDFKKSDAVQCVVTPKDNSGSGTPVSSSSVSILNSVPTLTSAVVTPSSPTVTSTLTCTPSGYHDDDGDPAVYTYAWKINGSPAAGKTSSTLNGSFVHGDVVTCVVTPGDGTGFGTPVSSSGVTILNTAPTVSVTITPASPVAGSSLTAVPVGSDADGDSLTYTYSWTVNNVPTASSTAVIPEGVTVAGEVWKVTVTPNDGATDGASASASVTIGSSSSPDVDGDGYTVAQGDCNDNNTSINPGATEVCNGVDDNCNSQTDEGFSPTTYYADADADGYGNAAVSSSACVKPSGYVTDKTDCNDSDVASYPSAPELLDGKDNDCNGVIDDRWATLYTYGVSGDSFPNAGTDSAIQIESDGFSHLFYSGQNSGGTAGANLYTRSTVSSSGFDTPTTLDGVLSPLYNRESLYISTGQTTQTRVLFYASSATGKPILFQNFTGYPTTGSTFLTVATGNSANPLVLDSLAMVTDQTTGTDYIAYPYFDGLKGSCAVGQVETKLVVVSRTKTGSTFSTVVNNPITNVCNTSGGPYLGSVSMTYGTQDSVMHLAWFNSLTGNGSAGLNYRRVIAGGGSPAKVVLGTTLGTTIGSYNAIASIKDPVSPFTGSVPVIAYFDATLSALRTVTGVVAGTSFGSAVTVVNSSTTGMGGTVPSAGRVVLRIQSDGTQHLLFQAASNLQLWYASNKSGSWVAEKVATSTTSIATQQYAMVIDADGNPRITYRDNSGQDLLYIKGKLNVTVVPY